MLPDIGIMIGCYIVTRMTSLLNKEEPKIVKIFSGITIAVAIIMTLDLIMRG